MFVLKYTKLFLREYVETFNKWYPGINLKVEHLSKIFDAKGIDKKKVFPCNVF